jgi:hypothetical protein
LGISITNLVCWFVILNWIVLKQQMQLSGFCKFLTVHE